MEALEERNEEKKNRKRNLAEEEDADVSGFSVMMSTYLKMLPIIKRIKVEQDILGIVMKAVEEDKN